MIRAAVGRAARVEAHLLSSSSSLIRPRPAYYTTTTWNRSSLRNGLFHEDLLPTTPTSTPLTTFQQCSESFHSGQPRRGWWSPKDDVTWLGRTLYRLGFTEIPKSLLKKAGYLIYMKVVDEVDYLNFFERCDLPDTYASWFIVMELHCWLLASRMMQNGKEGRIVRNALINAMWDDNETKSKKLEGALPAARRRDIQTLSQQFHAAMISYDEGLMGDDHILAGALWRRILRPPSDPYSFQPQQFEGDEHEKLAKRVKTLEMLVIYVRSQNEMLNGLSKEDFLRFRKIKFAPFDESLYELGSLKQSSRSSMQARAR